MVIVVVGREHALGVASISSPLAASVVGVVDVADIAVAVDVVAGEGAVA